MGVCSTDRRYQGTREYTRPLTLGTRSRARHERVTRFEIDILVRDFHFNHNRAHIAFPPHFIPFLQTVILRVYWYLETWHWTQHKNPKSGLIGLTIPMRKSTVWHFTGAGEHKNPKSGLMGLAMPMRKSTDWHYDRGLTAPTAWQRLFDNDRYDRGLTTPTAWPCLQT